MFQIIGLVLLFALVFGSFIISGGNLGVILHAMPHEMMAIGGAGIASFFAQRSAPPVDVMAGANSAVRDAFRRRLELVQKHNAQARAEVRLIVRAAGQTTVVESGAP